jgi:hypothetical protein
MVKRLLTRIAYALGLPALPYPNGERAPRFWPHPCYLWPALDTLEPPPSAALLSAEEAKERLREIVEGFFFRRLRSEEGSASSSALLLCSCSSSFNSCLTTANRLPGSSGQQSFSTSC